MRLLIVHDSKFGNGKKVAHTMARVLAAEETKISHNKDISAKKAAEFSPDILILGNAVRMLRMSRSTKIWLRKFNKVLIKSGKMIPFTLCFVTHARAVKKIESHVIKFHNYIGEMESIMYVYPKYILGQVVDIKGPLRPGVLQEIEEECKSIIEWFNEKSNSHLISINSIKR